MKIKINEPYLILKECELSDLPDFIVLTGENGSGKTQFLNYLYTSITKSYLPSMIDDPMMMHDPMMYNEQNAIYDESGMIIGYKEKAEIEIKEGIVSSIVYREIQAPNVEVGINYNIDTLLAKGNELTVKYISYINYIETYGKVNINLSKLNNIYQQMYTVTASNNNSRATLPSIIQQDIDFFIKITSLYPQINPTLIPYFHIAHQPLPNSSLFSTNLKFLYLQYWAKMKAGIELPEAPWITFNKIADAAKFRWQLEAPNFENDQNKFEIKLVDRSQNISISNIDQLSSGEKVIFSLVLAIYTSSIGVGFPQVIFFDEPDAYLHPSLCKEMLDVFQAVLVKDNRIKVIMTTHSPTTVALSPELSVYRMDRDLGYMVKSDKKEAIKSLTTGLNAINIFFENKKQIFVEASLDQFFLGSIYEAIQSQFLNSDIMLDFITTGSDSKDGGCDRVRNIVNNLFSAGNPFVHGIIDWDLRNNENDRIEILGNKNRYTVENYIFDPLAVTIFILHEQKEIEKIGFKLTDSILQFRDKTNQEIQIYIDNITAKLEENHIPNIDKSKVTYKTANNMEFYIPNWLATMKGHDLNDLYLKAFPIFNSYRKDLRKEIIKKSYKIYPEFIHLDIIQTLQKIQSK